MIEKKEQDINYKESDKWFKIISNVCRNDADRKVVSCIFPATTDSRFLRERGINAYGFSPMSNTPILLHEHNEYLSIKEFKKGIDVYTSLIPKLANHQDA